MNKSVSIIITFALILAFGIIFWGGSNKNSVSAQNVEIKNGIQYVTINAKGGYSPRVSVAQAEIPTKLIMKTTGTFDCSSALVINSINYQNILPQNGETEIDVGIWEKGETMQGLCSMGMYSFQIKFE